MGITNFDVVQANAFLGVDFASQGKRYYVNPRTGVDTRDGLSPETALKTVKAAYALCVARQNDIVYFLASGASTSADTTDYLSTVLTWAKDNTHLIGVCAPSMVSQRVRIAQLSTVTGLSPMVNITAQSCIFKNIQFFQGVADATSLVNVQITGQRNYFENVHFAGVGNATQSAAGAASLKFDGGSENVFRRCVIGLDTAARDADTAEIRFDTDASRNYFEDCIIQGFISAAGYVHVKVEDATGMDRWTIFKDCLFLSESTNDLVEQSVIMTIPVMSQGYIILQNSYYASSDQDSGTTVWSAGNKRIRNNSVAAAAAAAGGEMTIL